MSNLTDIQDALCDVSKITGKSPAELVRIIAVHINQGLTDTNTFTGFMPEEPDFCVGFYDRVAGEQSPNIALDWTAVQLIGRGGYEEVFGILSKIKLALQSLPNLALVNGDTLTGIWARTNVASLGRDSQERSLFSLNFRIAITPNNKGNRI